VVDVTRVSIPQKEAKMTQKTIRGIIRRKVSQWLAHIDDEELRKKLQDQVVVTGGCIVSLLLGEPVGDYDVYIKDRDVLTDLMRYYLRRFMEKPPPRFARSGAFGVKLRTDGDYPRIYVKSAGAVGEKPEETTDEGEETPAEDEGVYEYFEARPADDNETVEDYVSDTTAALRTEVLDSLQDPGYPNSNNAELVELVTDIANDETAPKETGPGAKEKNLYRPVFLSGNAITLSDKIQITTRFFGDVEDIHVNFDFVHCKCWYDHGENKLHLPQESLVSILTKELRYVGSLYPICSVIRTRKFIKRGWTCNAGQYIKMVDQVNQLDLDDINVWEDQLIGVDTAYFHELIAILREKAAKGAKIDHSYVIQMIDEMF
jgi:hypothetical protein